MKSVVDYNVRFTKQLYCTSDELANTVSKSLYTVHILS